MYSDDWRKAGYQKLNKVQLNDTLNFCYWKNQSGELAGITLNYELADDVHFELLYEEWMAFLSKELRLGQEMCNQDPVKYLNNKSWIELENRLKFHGITYKKIHF